MDFKKYLKKTVIGAVLIIVCFILQTSIFGKLPLGGVTPNLLIMLTSFFGFIYGNKEGTIVGFFSGLLLDMFFGVHFGMFALIYLSIGFLNGLIRKQFFGDDVKLPLLLVALSDLLYGLTVYLTIFLPRKKTNLYDYFMTIMMPEVMYTILVAFFLYFVFVRIKEWESTAEKRSESTYFG